MWLDHVVAQRTARTEMSSVIHAFAMARAVVAHRERAVPLPIEKQANVVYEIPCKVYIRETKRRLGTRLKDGCF